MAACAVPEVGGGGATYTHDGPQTRPLRAAGSGARRDLTRSGHMAVGNGKAKKWPRRAAATRGRDRIICGGTAGTAGATPTDGTVKNLPCLARPMSGRRERGNAGTKEGATGTGGTCGIFQKRPLRTACNRTRTRITCGTMAGGAGGGAPTSGTAKNLPRLGRVNHRVACRTGGVG